MALGFAAPDRPCAPRGLESYAIGRLLRLHIRVRAWQPLSFFAVSQQAPGSPSSPPPAEGRREPAPAGPRRFSPARASVESAPGRQRRGMGGQAIVEGQRAPGLTQRSAMEMADEPWITRLERIQQWPPVTSEGYRQAEPPSAHRLRPGTSRALLGSAIAYRHR